MKCSNCGKEFEGRFCPECGTMAEEIQEVVTEPIIDVCPNCGVERNGKFCVNCGYNFEEDKYIQPTYESQENMTAYRSEEPYKGNKVKSIIAKIYRYFIAGGMIFLGLVSLLCLSAPVIIEELFGMTESVGNGFSFIGGGDAPANVINACRMLLIMSLVCLIYGGAQLFFAFKKPYKTYKKYYLWVADGIISLILIILGGVIAGEAKGDGLINGKLGSGFAMCIVMGVFGLIFLGLRIFYELKVFAFEDTALDEDRIVKTKEKKERKPIEKEKVKKIAKRVGIPVAIIAVLLTIIIPSVVWSQNIFRVGKIDKINIGDSKEQVIKILGEPYEKSDYRYEYYSKDYVKLADKIKKELGYDSKAEKLAKEEDDWDIDLDDELGDMFEDFEKITKLEEQLMNLVYKYIRVDFDSDGKVSSVFYDAEKCESKEYKKVVNNYELKTKEILRYSATDIIYSVKLTDGSFYKGIALTDYITFSSGYISVKWSDEWKSDYKGEIKTKDNPNILYADYCGENVWYELRSNGELKIFGNGIITEQIDNKDGHTVIIGKGITSIEVGSYNGYSKMFSNPEKIKKIVFEKDSLLTSICEDAFRGCSNLTSIEIPSSVTSIGYEAFYGCSSLTIYCEAESQPSGWNSSWNDSGRPVVWNCTECGVTESGVKWGLTKEGIMTIAGYSGTSTEVIIPETINGHSVTSIGSYAFSGCSSLTSIEIPSSVTSIGYEAFYGCSSLTIYCEAESQPSGWSSDWNYNNNSVVWNYGGEKGTTESGIKWGLTKDGIITILGYSGDSTELVIPATINGHNVTSIGYEAFYYCRSLTSIEIPSGVTSIGSYAFSGCSSLTSIEIPSGVTSIGNGAFSNCSSMTSIEIPSSVTSIGYRAFEDCRSLTSIEMPSSVTSIGYEAFYGCSSLTSISIPSSVTSIDSYAFRGCSSLTGIEIPSGVTSIGSYAFSGCSSLTIYCEAQSKPSGWYSDWNSSNRPVVWGHNNITTNEDYDYVVHNDKVYLTKYKGNGGEVVVPSEIDNKEVIAVGEIFKNNKAITSISIPSSVTSIGSYAFYNCSSLTSVEIPSSVTSIGSDAFQYCRSLTSIEIPSSVTSIGSDAFYGCSSLTSIEIPSSVTSIGEDAFSGCSSLTSINVDAKNTKYSSQDGILYNKEKTEFIHIPKGISGAVVIPNSITSIGSSAFYGCSNLTSISIPSSVTSIGDRVFYNCSSLASIVIPSGVTSIGSAAFSNCSNLTSIEIPSIVTSIGHSAFWGCSSLTIYCEAESQPSGWNSNWNNTNCPVVWNSKNNDIASDGNIYYVAENGIRYALKDGKATVVGQSKSSISGAKVIPSEITYKETTYSVTSIGYEAFYNCSSLTSIEIPSSVTSIGSYAFGGCSSLTIYCEASSKPSGWSSSWNYSNRPVEWGHKISG